MKNENVYFKKHNNNNISNKHNNKIEFS